MSSGPFNLVKYETGKGFITAVRSQPETAGLTLNGGVNAPPVGSRTPGVPIMKVSGTRRGYGQRARTVSVVFLAVPAGGQYQIGNLVRLPVYSPTVWESYTDGDEGTYLGAAVRFAGKSAEVIK